MNPVQTKLLTRFLRSDSGAVTVDWVVLTAAIIGMSLAVVVTIRTAATDPADSIGAQLTSLGN